VKIKRKILNTLLNLNFLADNRLVLHKLFSVKEKRPYFRRSTSLFQSLTGLVSPHVTLTGKFRETEIIRGHYEYRHYMQEEFNDDGWGLVLLNISVKMFYFSFEFLVNMSNCI